MDTTSYSKEALLEQIDIYKDRIETISDYINGATDLMQRYVMENQLNSYKITLQAFKSELQMRAVAKKFVDIDITIIFEKIKNDILEKLNIEESNSHRFIYRNVIPARNFKDILSFIKLNTRHFNQINLINEKFFNQIPDEILIENKIYINKKDIIEERGRSLFIDCGSIHKSTSESDHYGKCNSFHYDKAESYHFNNSKSEHWNNCKSIHFDNTLSIHHDNSDPQIFDKATFKKITAD